MMIWNYLKGKRTYLVSFLIALYGAGVSANLWPHVPIVDALLAGGGLAALRAGVSNEVAKATPTVATTNGGAK